MKKCQICGRTPLKGNLKSHSNIKTIRRQKVNLQTKKINGKKMVVCTKCLKTLNKPAKNKKTNKAKESK